MLSMSTADFNIFIKQEQIKDKLAQSFKLYII